MNRDLNLIGPHEDIEFKLLDEKKKHVALFYEIIPQSYYDYIEYEDYKGLSFTAKFLVNNTEIEIDYKIIYRVGYEQDALRLKQLKMKQDFNPNNEREIGRILGYPKVAIEYFISNFEKKKKEKK